MTFDTVLAFPETVRYGLVVRIPGSHPGGPGSIPGNGNFWSMYFSKFYGLGPLPTCYGRENSKTADRCLKCQFVSVCRVSTWMGDHC